MVSAAKKRVLFGGGVPSWAVGMSAWKDYTTNFGSLGDPTDTHAATIYAPNAAGLYSPFAANVLTRTNLGLQTVPSRTQLLSNPTDFSNATWNNTSNSTIVTDTAVAPDGTTTMDRLVEAANTGEHGRGINNAAVTAGSTYTYVVYVQPNGRTNFIVRTNLVAAATFVNCGFLLSGAGSITRAPAGYTLAIQRVGTSDTYMIAVTGVADATGSKLFTNDLLDVAPTTDGTPSYTGDGASGVYLWGGNLYVGAFAVPPILSAATVNGNQQVISGLGTQLATGVAGIVQVNQITPVADATFPRFININDGTPDNSVRVSLSSSQYVLSVVSGGVSQASVTAGNAALGVSTVAFVATSNYAMARAVGASAPSPDTSLTYPVVDRVALGGNGYGTTANLYGFSRKLALRYLTASDDPASVFAQMYAQAVLAAAS